MDVISGVFPANMAKVPRLVYWWHGIHLAHLCSESPLSGFFTLASCWTWELSYRCLGQNFGLEICIEVCGELGVGE